MANRPASAASRNAWVTDQGMDNSAYHGGDDVPAAMTSEAYDGSLRVEEHQQPVVQVSEPENGCWFKFKRGIRCKY